ncbi:MAG: MerR family transcriptional regulator [Holophagaceae bacterium]
MAKGDGSGLLSIGDISAVTGLSVDVIRIWERRYGFPTPIRLPSGHRRYPDTDLQRLRLIAEALAHGQRPALVARADADALRRMILPTGGSRLDALWQSVEAMDPDRMRNLLQGYLEGMGWQPFLQEVVKPLLDRVGIAWAEGEIGLHHEHLLTEVLEDLLRRMRQVLPVLAGEGRVLLCTLPGERHRLGLLMAALVFAGRGSRTDLMGVDLPLASIAQAAKLLRVNRVAISLSIQHTGEPMRRMILDLKDRLPEDCLVLIGGKGAARTRRIRGVGRMPELDMI